MAYFIEFLKGILFGFFEGVGQILPISATAHRKMFDRLFMIPEGVELIYPPILEFFALLGVFIFLFRLIWPLKKDLKQKTRHQMFNVWIRVGIATIPALIFGICFDIFLAKYLSSLFLIPFFIILYGLTFLFIEFSVLKGKDNKEVATIYDITLSSAILIGLAQILSFIPGTSRLGITIIAALLLGCKRTVSIEFSIILAMPLIFILSLYKIISVSVEGDILFTGPNVLFLITSSAIAFITSFFLFRFVHLFFTKFSFKWVGLYKVLFGILFLILFLNVFY